MATVIRVTWLSICLTAACSSSGDGGDATDGDATDGDATDGVDDGCAEIEPLEPGGEAALGTGYDGFEPLGEEIGIIAGPQGGFHVNLNARVRGLDFGNPEDLLDPRNPSTSFAIHRLDERLDIMVCPVRLAYEASDGEFGELQRGVSVVFELAGGQAIDELFDQVVRLEVEVVDADGRHSSDDRTVTLRAPAGTP